MQEHIFSPDYWANRIKEAPIQNPHHAVFKCHKEIWEAIENRHREILAAAIGPLDSIIDCGCAWGRLLDLLPREWRGDYLGLDLSPDFIAKARKLESERRANNPELTYRAQFQELDLQKVNEALDKFTDKPKHGISSRYTWAVFVSIRPMIKRHAGEDTWNMIAHNVRSVAERVLYLEYDVNDKGEIQLC